MANTAQELVIITVTNGRVRTIKFRGREAIDLRAAVIGALENADKRFDVPWDMAARTEDAR